MIILELSILSDDRVLNSQPSCFTWAYVAGQNPGSSSWEDVVVLIVWLHLVMIVDVWFCGGAGV